MGCVCVGAWREKCETLLVCCLACSCCFWLLPYATLSGILGVSTHCACGSADPNKGHARGAQPQTAAVYAAAAAMPTALVPSPSTTTHQLEHILVARIRCHRSQRSRLAQVAPVRLDEGCINRVERAAAVKRPELDARGALAGAEAGAEQLARASDNYMRQRGAFEHCTCG